MTGIPTLEEKSGSQFVRDSGLSFIEQLQNLSVVPCENAPYIWLFGLDRENKVAMICRPACKRWACRTCAARNARKWIARIIHGVNNQDGAWFMFTLTAHEKMRKGASVINLREGWKKLYNRMKYNFQDMKYYVRVWERHQEGTFHLHGLIDEEIPQDWLKDNARECGMGYQVDIHEVDNAGQVAGYIAKYFLKSESSFTGLSRDFPSGLRRIEASRNWIKLPELEMFDKFQWSQLDTYEGAISAGLWHVENYGYRLVDLAKD